MRHRQLAGAFAAALISAALLAGCGGGGGGANAPVAPATKAAAAAQSVVVTINIPGRTPAGTRRATYVGATTQSAVFIVTPGSGTASPSVTTNCTTVCQATLSVFPGSTTFTVSLYNGTNGSGSLLSTGTHTQTIVAGTNAVNLTFNGVPVTAVIGNPGATFSSGVPATTTVQVDAQDADGNTIVAPGVFTSSIALTTSQSYITLSPTTVTAPATPVTVTYDGTAVGSTTGVNLLAAIGSGSAVVGNTVLVVFSAPPPSPLLLDQSMVTVTHGGATTNVTLSETGFGGMFTADDTACSGPGYASVSPPIGSGPSAMFTITPGANTTGSPCTIMFSDSSQNATLSVTVN